MVAQSIDHIGVRVDDAERSIAFYTQVLGMRLSERRPFNQIELIFLELDGQIVELIAGAHDEVPDRGRVDHIAFKVENLEAAIAEITAAAPQVVFTDIKAMWDGLRVVFFSGPDGEWLELVERSG